MLSSTFRILPNYRWGVTRWSVVRGDGLIMAIFATEEEASAYYDKKNAGSVQ